MMKTCNATFTVAALLLLCLLLHSIVGAPQEPCMDLDEHCAERASDNKCVEDPAFMAKNCRDACGWCKNRVATTYTNHVPLSEEDDIDNYQWFFDMGVPQLLNSMNLDDFHDVQRSAFEHLLAVSLNPDLYPMINHCKNKHAMCTQWALSGNCFDNGVHNQHMMEIECCPVCGSASQLQYLLNCPLDHDAYTAFKEEGDVTLHFERTINEFPQYNPLVLSRPTYLPEDNEDSASYKIGPWILTLDGVATEAEMDRLIYWGQELGYERSLDGGDGSLDGSWEAVETHDRTSSETFCDDDCEKDPIIEALTKRIEDLVGIPSSHSDYIQLLHYNENEFYKTHQDYHPHQVFSATGARILTFYLYLNDVEEGGGTNFPYLNLTVLPKRGRAVMWANVQDEDPNEEHLYARHQALPVIKSEKYGSTWWFHHRDFKNNDPDLCGR